MTRCGWLPEHEAAASTGSRNEPTPEEREAGCTLEQCPVQLQSTALRTFTITSSSVKRLCQFNASSHCRLDAVANPRVVTRGTTAVEHTRLASLKARAIRQQRECQGKEGREWHGGRLKTHEGPLEVLRELDNHCSRNKVSFMSLTPVAPAESSDSAPPLKKLLQKQIIAGVREERVCVGLAVGDA
jgi:hypothetical protein